MWLKFLQVYKSGATFLFGVFLLSGIVNCEGESQEEDEASQEQTIDTGEGTTVPEEVEEEKKVKKGGNKCDLVNLTRPCCDGAKTQVCTKELVWSECDCSAEEPDIPTEWIEESEIEGNMRSDISFEWEENDNVSVDCKPGLYKGRFNCNRTGMVFTGPVSITLQESDNGEFLEIVDGELGGTAVMGLLAFQCKLVGGLDFSKNVFEADAIEGKYNAMQIMKGKFDGHLDGQCDPEGLSLSGTWGLKDGFSDVPCEGPWSITFKHAVDPVDKSDAGTETGDTDKSDAGTDMSDNDTEE